MRVFPLAALLLLLGCEGSILGDGSTPPGGTANPVPGGDLSSGPSDDDLRARDPQLFDIAL
jgi:hypothetical protein